MIFIDKLMGICYNKKEKERDDNYMNLKRKEAQISVFLKDGIMNPSKYKNKINDIFSGLFEQESLSINVNDAPDELPLVKCSSKDNMLNYEFSRKRINFYISFLSKNKMLTFDEYKNKILKLINDELLSVTDISRIGIAVVYYYDIDDNDNEYWINKYKFPLINDSASQLLYVINKAFEKDELKFNNIINLSNTSVNGKVVPSVSVDINNIPVDRLTKDQLEYIFKECKKYDIDTVNKLLTTDEQE